MNEIGFREYKSFIEAFHKASHSEEYRYVSIKGKHTGKDFKYTIYGEGYKEYSTLRTQQIAELSQKSIAYISSSSCQEPLEDRVSLLQNLKSSLTICAQRIENSIKNRWWYWILHLFGYQAKCPEYIQKALHDTDSKYSNLKLRLEQQKSLQKEEQEKQSKAKAKEEEQAKSAELIKQQIPLQVPEVNDTSQDIETPADPKPMQPIAVVPFNFAGVLDVIKCSHVYPMLTFKEIAWMQQVSKTVKQSTDRYLNKPAISLNYMKELVLSQDTVKRSYHVYLNVKYKFCLDSILKNPDLKIILQKNKDFRREFLNHVKLHLDLEQNSKWISLLIDIFF